MHLMVLLAALCVATSTHADTTFQFDITIGAYAVGLRIAHEFDEAGGCRTRYAVATGAARTHLRTPEVDLTSAALRFSLGGLINVVAVSGEGRLPAVSRPDGAVRRAETRTASARTPSASP
jgi:hypothetical protein